MTEIIDDLIPTINVNKIENILLSHDFPWYLNKCVVDKSLQYESFLKDKKTVDSIQFTHIFFSNDCIKSNLFHLVEPFSFLLKKHTGKDHPNKLLRVKANLLTKNELYPDDCYNYPHTDSNSIPGESLLYYVNQSDGDTFLFNEKRGTNFDDLTLNRRISPKKGSCLYFDSDYFHASSCPKNSDVRVVINFLYAK